MKYPCPFTCLICIVMVLFGFYFCYYSVKYPSHFVEGFQTYSCPNMLVQKGCEIYLYDSTKVTVPGVNPIKFKHLDEYVEFMEWQKSQNITCPALYLQYTFDSQGNETYKLRPDILEPEGGLNSTTEFNKTNAMDPEWDGNVEEKDEVDNSTAVSSSSSSS